MPCYIRVRTVDDESKESRRWLDLRDVVNEVLGEQPVAGAGSSIQVFTQPNEPLEAQTGDIWIQE